MYKEKVEDLAEPEDRFAEALAAAERADVVVLCLGLDASIEGEEGDVSNEYASGDKMHLNLPGLQQDLLEAVYQTNKKVILVLLSGSALAITWADQHVPAIVQAWYPGAEGGKAVASLVFGDFSPSGRLPVTFYRSTEELPDFHDYSMKNRTYRYMDREALYPFGYGLSFTSFAYGVLNLPSQSSMGENIECSITVKNTGAIEATEIVQLYTKDIEASVAVPHWQLRGIQKIFMLPGEEKTLLFVLTPRDFSLIDQAGKRIVEPGVFEIYVGGCQPDNRSQMLSRCKVSKGMIELVGQSLVLPY